MHFHEQTDFDGGPVQAHHKWKEACKKGTLFCYSLLSSSPRFSSTQLCATRSHSELNQEFTFVPHDLLKQFACHSSNMGSQSFSLPHVSPISYHLALHLSIIFGAKFSRFLCNFHDYPRRRGEKLKFFPSICIESSSKMRALIQITHRTTFRLAFSCFVMQRLNLIKCNARWLKEINSISLIFTFKLQIPLLFEKDEKSRNLQDKVCKIDVELQTVTAASLMTLMTCKVAVSWRISSVCCHSPSSQ